MIRKVRVSSTAFDKLDFLFPLELPSLPEKFTLQDFIDLELPTILESFAKNFDDLPAIDSHLPRYRYVLIQGVFIPKITAFGFLHVSNEVSIVDMELNLL